MSILDSVLHYCAPAKWENNTKYDYENVRYKLYDVNSKSTEYAAEVNAFVDGESKLTVTKIQRVQNPFQLGRFVIRKEQIKYRGENVDVVKYYHPLRMNDLEVALEHNMDVRRYGTPPSSEKNPYFYKTPALAFDAVKPCEIILICNVLKSANDGLTISKGNDSEYMPTYVVNFDQPSL